MNKLKKIMSRLSRAIIFLFDGINTKLYMKLYNKWLLKNQLDMKGPAKFIHHSVCIDGIDYKLIHFGKNIVISRNVLLLTHDFSIETGFVSIGKSTVEGEAYVLSDIYIGDNCFIGANVTILPGTIIGDNCIVGAGSVLPGKRYPSNSVIVGNPAKVVSSIEEWANRKYDEGNYLIGYFK